MVKRLDYLSPISTWFFIYSLRTARWLSLVDWNSSRHLKIYSQITSSFSLITLIGKLSKLVWFSLESDAKWTCIPQLEFLRHLNFCWFRTVAPNCLVNWLLSNAFCAIYFVLCCGSREGQLTFLLTVLYVIVMVTVFSMIHILQLLPS